MSTEKICRIYEGHAVRQVTGDSIRPGGLSLTDRAINICALPPGSKILDVGCGTGATVEHLIDKYKLNAVGVDPSAVLLEKGRQRRSDLPIFQAVGECLPFAQGDMDCIFAECSLSLMINVDLALSEFHRVLKNNGLLVISDIYARNPEGVCRLRSLPVESCLKGAMSKEGLIKRIDSAGFKIKLWEDHSDLLKELTFQLIMAHGSLENFWQSTSPGELDVIKIKQIIAKSGPGYFLLIAAKQERD
ncbi:DVU_1556 family methyltransferase [Desulforamulus hydrothermalis]|uniref:Methyltransferase type 11 n=1 Tax=Desulforamulus hydrothermalis Lam5 = DSM 18033 TaxID=1121428 RepID=K8EBX4_9FIRM|nr:class I SAM-dependent methyltransferase [Desulforamulus hydrothermalis]CCO09203.1 Methyltransferase type 11 [Desulforamulus hydrothermalis Lam5 = DSM 18033]SHH10732.1 Methyltransferase domain-containing protein [Desulforamulus hydrothermalis Lam5 = DSM 18033]